ncbi:MAG: DUF4149 domain-containing protein [Isosphaeraceae bacterium]|nr:DUF4149 domain-containing protein [Isosphaeraceae bacterium]
MFSARLLLPLFDIVYLFCLVGFLGAILFFSFGVAPIIFRVLEPSDAARFVRALFPRYYLWNAVAAAVALPAMLGVPLSFPEFRGPAIAVNALIIIACTLLMLYCGNSLTPAINAARDAGRDQAARFDRLHKQSVRLNAIALLLGSILLIQFAVRPTPVTDGIIELSPEQRAEYDREALKVIDRLIKGKPVTDADSKLDPAGRAEIEALFEAKRLKDAARKAAASGRD